jgi:hypothetical protein
VALDLDPPTYAFLKAGITGVFTIPRMIVNLDCQLDWIEKHLED